MWRRKALTSGVVAPSAGAPNKPVKYMHFEAVRSDLVAIIIGHTVMRAGTNSSRWL